MKLLVKILLYVFTVLIASLNVANAAILFLNIQETATSYSFQDETSRAIYKVIKNDEVNYCKNEQDLVDYRIRVIAIEVIAAKGVAWEARIAEEIAHYNRLADPYLDCSDIASTLNRSHSGGYILELSPKTGKWLTGLEYCSKTEFTYHQVFVKGKYVYDPMFSSKPVLTSEFIKSYQQMNKGGINLLRK